MDTTEKNENWDEKKSQLKAKLSALKANDSLYDDTKQDEMLNKIQLKTDMTKEELHIIIEGI